MTGPDLSRALAVLYGEPSPPTRLTKLRGDASSRSYYRLAVSPETSTPRGPQSLIVMELPEDALRSDEGGDHPEVDRLPFLEVAELLRSRGLPVPEVYVEDLDRGVILLEDLGDTTFERALSGSDPERQEQLYGSAVDLLARMHDRCSDLPPSSIAMRRRFDRGLLEWELAHFEEWGLEAPFGPLGDDDRITLRAAFSRIVDEIHAMPFGFVHRDYQSKNLMLGETDRLTIIDFQDALQGPRVYDLVALLCDSYVALPLSLQARLADRYAAARGVEPSKLRQELWTVALHRKLKDAGRFVYIDRVRRNPDFLQWFPQSLVYVGRAASELEGYEGLNRLLERIIPGYPDAVPVPESTME